MKQVSKTGVAIGVVLVSFVLLMTSVISQSHVGYSSYVLTQHLSIDPLPVFANPVYGWLIKAIAALAGSSVVYAVNVFSAFCGACVLGLIFIIVYRFCRIFNADKALGPPAMHRVQLFSGLLSTMYLLAATPFCMAATRANSMTFDLLLLLSAFYLAMSPTKENIMRRLSLASLLYGIAIVEFNTAILAAPFFAILLLYQLWVFNSFNLRHIFILSALGLIGLSLYIIQAGLYWSTPAYEWREFKYFLQIFYYIWQEQYQSLMATLPRVGWLTIAFVSIIPWITTSAFRAVTRSSNAPAAMFGTAVLNAMLTVLAVLLLLDFPLAPMSLTGTFRLFVTPYVLIALWVGNLAAFWMVFFFREKRFEGAGFRAVRQVFGWLLAACFPLYLLYVILVLSLPRTQHDDDLAANRFAQLILDVAGDKEWLITNTPFDDNISLEAYRRGNPINIIRLSHTRSGVYMKYVARLLKDYPRLESLARIGMPPLLDEWLVRLPDAEKKVAVVHLADIWLMSGFEAVPDRAVFRGARVDAENNPDLILQQHRAFWEEIDSLLKEQEGNAPIGGSVIPWMRLHFSKLANNLGVYLEDHGRSEDAYACYQKAREFAPENLSALMNMYVLAQHDNREDLAALDAELKIKTENLVGKVQTWALSQLYGFVRVPELFANRGMAFAMSGKANLAISDLKKSLALRQENPQIQMALAGMYLSQDKFEQSKEYYLNVLTKNPGNANALLGLMQLSLRQGEVDEARRYLAELKETDADPTAIMLEEAILESFTGAPAKGMRLLRDVVKKQPENMQAWAAIAITAAQLNDVKAGDEAMTKLREAKVLSPNILLVMAQSALEQKDRDGARRYLGDVLRRNPGHIKALEMMLRIDLSEGNRDQVQKTVEQVLTHDPANALANYMLGVHHYYNEEYALAEASYRASLATSRTPEALNDLAYVLTLQNKPEEAEAMIRESLEINDRNAAAWDTLGVILMKQDQLDEAEKALVKSLALRPGTATVTLSLALLYEKQKRWDEAAKLVDDVSSRLNDLPRQDQVTLRNLQQRLLDR